VTLNFSVPAGWGRATLDELASLVTDGDHNPPRRVEAGVPHLTAKNVKRWRLILEGCSFVDDAGYAQTSARYSPAAGDLIVTCVGTIGETAVVPPGLKFSADRNLAAVRLHPGGLLPEMLQIILNAPPWSTWLRSASGSTAQPHLYLGSLRMLPVPVPPLALQRHIVAKIAETLSNVDALELTVDAARRHADRLRAAILRAAFDGRLVAPEKPARAPAA
jgi:type I restriction enzyme S subunit